MKYFIVILLFLTTIYAQEEDVDIQSDSFLADKTKNIIIFTGNVSMVKNMDTLVCKELTVHTKISEDTNKTVMKKYIAVGNVSLTLQRPTTLMIGNGDKIIYDIDEQIYIIDGNGYLEDVNGSKTIRGEKIFIDEKTGNTKIDGDENKPVQFKLKIESK